MIHPVCGLQNDFFSGHDVDMLCVSDVNGIALLLNTRSVTLCYNMSLQISKSTCN